MQVSYINIFCQANCHNAEMPDKKLKQFLPLAFNEDFEFKKTKQTKNQQQQK